MTKLRTERHDEIKDFILKRTVEKDKEVVVTRDLILRSLEEVLKPDLVVKNREEVLVVDVRHEDGDYLQIGRSKIDKDARLLPHLQERFNIEIGEVLPTVIGTRGRGRCKSIQLILIKYI
jgi:hypothetical protein